ncbi:MAG: alpha-hydroxy-acid oxidizing protein, partial [Methylobacteriaceae bacterium]|nr:alpha-hydroxy-acid oxidizing protein [Methylobacteriaceae bacterium]
STAKAAAAERVPMIFSNQASVPMETMAHAMGDAPRWFQLYWSKSDDLVASLVKRAEACGCDAIAVTLDTTLLGWRTRDLDYAYLPFIRGMGIAQYTSDPVFRSMLKKPPEEDMLGAAQLFMTIYSNPALTWDKLAFLREHTTKPILLKGINHPDDARKALDHSIDGIVVSNHGGRQVDGARAALDSLDEISQAVNGRMPILFDSGIRGGAGIFKALALGATAVCIGRPYVYGLALAGEAGVRAVIRNMMADLDLTMGTAGCASIKDINRDMLVRV